MTYLKNLSRGVAVGTMGLILLAGTPALAADNPQVAAEVMALARAGLLDSVRHTANGPESLPATGYGGSAYYVGSPRAVLDRRIVTAPGTAPISFMGAVLESLGLRNGDLDFYLGLYAAEHQAA